MKLLAVDPGTYNAGFYDGKLRICKTYGKKDPLEKRLYEFMVDLDYLLTLGRYTAVAFEKNFLRGIHATEALTSQCGIIMAHAEKHECACLPIKITDWKKWAGLSTGTKKSGDKQPTISLATALSGVTGLSEHEADAIVIWNYVIANAQEKH